MQPDAADQEQLMDHCALECMHAIENKDADAFLESFHVLVADVMNRMNESEESEEEEK